MNGKIRAFPGRKRRRHEKTSGDGGGDRSLGLVLAASLQGLVAMLLALFAAMNGAAVVLGEGARGAHAGALLLEALGAVSVGALAAGVLFLRRWAASFSLAVSWLALFAGGNALALELAAVPELAARLGRAPAVAHPQLTLVVLLATQTLLFVLLPLGFALFYRRSAVAMAFRRGDAEAGWTDRHPAAILLFATSLVGVAVLALAIAVTEGATGRWLGAGGAAVLATLVILAARGVLSRKRWAWLVSLLLLMGALAMSVFFVARPLFASAVARVAAGPQGAAVHFYLSRFFSRGYQALVALQAAILLASVWHLRGHFRRSLQVVESGPRQAR